MVLHTSSHPTMDYTAREEDGVKMESLLKHYVGVYDPETGELQVVEAKRMSIHGTIRSRKAEEDLSEPRKAKACFPVACF